MTTLNTLCKWHEPLVSAIPPVIRANIDLWVLFKFASKERLLDQIYNEISSLLSIDKFEELYDYATTESKHDALIIDNHNRVNKDFMFRKNWNTVLKITKHHPQPQFHVIMQIVHHKIFSFDLHMH